MPALPHCTCSLPLKRSACRISATRLTSFCGITPQASPASYGFPFLQLKKPDATWSWWNRDESGSSCRQSARVQGCRAKAGWYRGGVGLACRRSRVEASFDFWPDPLWALSLSRGISADFHCSNGSPHQHRNQCDCRCDSRQVRRACVEIAPKFAEVLVVPIAKRENRIGKIFESAESARGKALRRMAAPHRSARPRRRCWR